MIEVKINYFAQWSIAFLDHKKDTLYRHLISKRNRTKSYKIWDNPKYKHLISLIWFEE